MPERDVDNELRILIHDLGMSQEEAQKALGIMPVGDPLVSSQDGPPSAFEDSAYRLAEMFPHIPISTIEQICEGTDGDIDKSSEQLLSWELVNSSNEESEDTRPRQNKFSKQNRKIQRKLQKEVDSEESDIAVLSTTFKIPMEEARELYWTHNSDITAALLSKTPVQPLTVSVSSTSLERPSSFVNNPYRDLPHYELKRLIGDTKLRIQTLRAKARSSTKDPVARTRAQDAATDMNYWQSELRLLELALTKSEVMHSSGLSTGNDKLDLHGCTLEQAKVIVSEAVTLVERGSRSRLEIVTGAGRHSLGGRPILKIWVHDYLKQRNVKIQELEGSFLVYPRVCM